MAHDTETTTNTTDLILVRTNRGDFDIHAPGCADLTRGGKYRGERPETITVEAGEDPAVVAAEWIYCDIAGDSCSTDEEYDAYFAQAANEMNVLPCAHAAHALTVAEADEPEQPDTIGGAPADLLDDEDDGLTVEARQAIVAHAETFGFDEVGPGTPAAAAAEIARRKHNRTVKRTGEGTREEAASEWAFNATADELKTLVG